jgi:hypothetical protein
VNVRRRQHGGFEWRAPLVWVATVVAALVSGAGCSPQEVPQVPTYEADIRPLVLSRCVRCHGGGGTLNGDPKYLGGFPASDGRFDLFDDPPCAADAGTTPCHHGMFFFATDTGPLMKRQQLIDRIHHKAGLPPMPPPPSPALTSTQLEIFDAWLAEDPPLEK